MYGLAKPLVALVEELRKLPSIGPKTAERIAFYLLGASKQDASRLARAIVEVKERVKPCKVCFNPTESDLCSICLDERRERSVICVVEQPVDLISLEKTGHYKGLYHVLGGAISPLDNIGPEDVRIGELEKRVAQGGVKEVIVATNPSMEGEATALYISKLLKKYDVKVTRIASGLPVGADLEYADEVTLARALEGRREM